MRREDRRETRLDLRAKIIYGADSYKRFAEENGFRQEVLEKVIRLGQVASTVAEDSFLSTRLVLKGGTALNLVSDPIRRLSVDLDFNYIGSISLEEMLKDKTQVIENFRLIGARLDYTCGVPKDAHGSSTFSLRYINSLGTQDRIEVDINWITRIPLGPLQQRQLWQPSGVVRPLLTMVSNEELVAGKLRALLDRVAARDVFDTGFLPEILNAPWPSTEVKALFVLFTGTLDHPLTHYSIDRLDRLSESDYQNKLLPVLSLSDVPDRLSLIAKAKRVLRPMLELDEAQKEYVQRLQVGDYQPELLLPHNPDLAERLRLHPALQWKARNAREHHARRP